MPWKCPACQEQIIHTPFEDIPRLGVRYRCHICRMELEFDREKGRLQPVPLQDDEVGQRHERRTS